MVFDSKNWSKLIEMTYGYESSSVNLGESKVYFSKVVNKIGEYFVLPSFGDYTFFDDTMLGDLEQWAMANPERPIKIKALTNKEPKLENFHVSNSGYIHQLELKTYDDWINNKRLHYRFKRYLRPKYLGDLSLRIDNTFETLESFYSIHKNLRINKFKEVPQPREFFHNLYELFFKENKGHIVGAFKNDKLIAGILILINNKTCYYKFNASINKMLQYRPNNHLIDFLVRFLSEQDIKILDLGFTGSSNSYSGLREYKKSIGAREYIRYNLHNNSLKNLDFSMIEEINFNIQKLISNSYSTNEIDLFSSKYYKYFI